MPFSIDFKVVHSQSLLFVYLFVCMFIIYIYICICICMYVYICICMYMYICICMYIYIYVYICICICMYMYVYVYICVCICIYIYVYTYVYIYPCNKYISKCCFVLTLNKNHLLWMFILIRQWVCPHLLGHIGSWITCLRTTGKFTQQPGKGNRRPEAQWLSLRKQIPTIVNIKSFGDCVRLSLTAQALKTLQLIFQHKQVM